MAKRNSINLSATPNADGFALSGGTTERSLTVTGGDVTLTGSGSAVITFPSSTATLATLALAETLTNKTLTAAKIASAGFLADANGNELIIFTTTASAVNELTYANGSTGVNPKWTSSGETNVGMDFQVKGTGVYRFLSTASGPTDIRLFEDTDNGSNYASIIAPATLGSNIVLTLPSATGTFATLAGTESLSNKTISAVTQTITPTGATAGLAFSVTGTAAAHMMTVTIDTSNAGNKALVVTNATNFAHAGNYIELNYLNASDTGKAILIANAGGGNAIDVTQKDSTEMVSLKFNATQANVTASDTFIAFKSTSGTEGSIAGTAGAGTLAYNTFTGSHWTRVEDEDVQPYDLLEIIPGDPGINSKKQLFRTRVCATRSSKAAVGVYGGRDREGYDMALSIGTGLMNVANKGKNVEIGDFLMSSDVRGHAELQDIGAHMYQDVTIAKATENITWNEGETSRRISVIYLGG